MKIGFFPACMICGKRKLIMKRITRYTGQEMVTCGSKKCNQKAKDQMRGM